MKDKDTNRDRESNDATEKSPASSPSPSVRNTDQLTAAQRMELTSGIAAFEAKEFRRAWQLLQPLAEIDCADALYRCAIMAQNGLGAVAQPETAARMMMVAAQQGLGLAQHSLGVMYLFGEGVAQNTALAIEWLEKAGDSGLAGAWSTLGMIYAEGKDVTQDIDKARIYYERAGFDPDDLL